MSCHAGNKLISDGLVLNIDAANPRSHRGIESDRIGSIAPAWGVWGGLTGTSVAYQSKYGPGVHLNTVVGGGVNYWYSSKGGSSCIPSTQYIVSARVKFSGGTPSANLFYVRQHNTGGGQTSESGKFTTGSIRLLPDGFYYCWAYFITDPTAVSFYVHGYEYGGGLDIWIENMQCRRAGLADVSGNNNDVTFVNGLETWNLGGGTTAFDGVSDHAIISTFNNKPVTQITCSAWVYPTNAVGTGTIRGGAISCTSSTYLGIIDSTDGGVTSSLHWAIQTSTNRLHSWDGKIPSNQWSYITGTYDGVIARAYLNGNQVWAANVTGTISDGTYYIGCYGPQPVDDTHNFQGGIAHALIYNKALSAADVRCHYNATRSRFGV